jgi:UDP-N-acetylmuramyl pentapeptide phosphotransferase/UDP-N-acetylglucosamine-1-phosphate transferase
LDLDLNSRSKKGFSGLGFTDRLGLSVSQAVFAWGLVVLIGGVAGLVSMLLCFYVLSFGGVDSANKHGISQVSATRVGGLAIVSYMLMHLWYQGQLVIDSPLADENSITLICLSFFALGIFEDLRGNLSARSRFVAMLLVALVALVLSPSLVLQPVGIVWVDVILQASAVVALLFTAICMAFIPNAFNTADGANGLIAGTSLFALAGLATVADPALGPFLLAALVGCLVFLVFNLVSGRFFLGDGGAYFLGALCGLGFIKVSNSVDVAVWWLLALAFYPIADLIWSVGRRVFSGRSPFEPDNQHLHNLLFAWFNSGSMSSAAANSLTGVSIALLFSGLPVFIVWSGAWAVTSAVWLLWVFVQWCVYIFIWKYLSDKLCALPEELGQK